MDLRDLKVNPPAFARQEGMTLLDYFAGQALVGILDGCTVSPDTLVPADPDASVLASMVYGMARAMLAERQKARNGGPDKDEESQP